jgi:hypothetical protein
MDDTLFKSIDLSQSAVEAEDSIISRLDRIEENQFILSAQLARVLARMNSLGHFSDIERQRLDMLKGVVSQVKSGIHQYIDTIIETVGARNIPRINLSANFTHDPAESARRLNSARDTLMKHSREFRELKKVI